MTRITLQDGKLVLRDGKIGTEQACCCGPCTGFCEGGASTPQTISITFSNFVKTNGGREITETIILERNELERDCFSYGYFIDDFPNITLNVQIFPSAGEYQLDFGYQDYTAPFGCQGGIGRFFLEDWPASLCAGGILSGTLSDPGNNCEVICDFEIQT